MIEIGTFNKTAPALARSDFAGDVFNRVRPAYARNTVGNINLGKRLAPDGPTPRPAQRPPAYEPTPRPAQRPPAYETTPPVSVKPPELLRPALKGQKVALGIAQGQAARLRVAFGWNVKDARCDVDASAFLLNGAGRVPADEWFVFYGQPDSPDRAVGLRDGSGADRQAIDVDLGRLDPEIQRLVFVLTINEALERQLDFGMIADAWLRVLDDTGRELVSYRPTELYDGVTSMTLGELYLRKGEWRFNPVGNGVHTDLAGQCAVYGVNIGD